MDKRDTYKCYHCRGDFDLLFWHIPLDEMGLSQYGSFCTPECALGFNKFYVDKGFPPENRAQRKAFFMQKYRNVLYREVFPAPVQVKLHDRSKWLPLLRKGQNEEILRAEMALSFFTGGRKKK